MERPAPRYGWYGDDFTGATDTLATLAEGGQRAMLFMRLPTQAQLAAAGPLDALGIAGASRTMAPEAIAAELAPIGAFMAGHGIGLMHYKCCSTFDSAPHIGSIGAATRALRPHFGNPLVPVVGGQPNLGRYCLFGNLFAAAGSGGAVHRIDRHPTMSAHPVTPMGEADLRRHLAAQGLERIALIDYRSHEHGRAAEALDDALGPQPDAVLFDVAREADLDAIGGLIAAQLPLAPMLAIGPSSVAQAFARTCAGKSTVSPRPETSRPRRGPVLALVGSLSPVTRAQVEAASGYAKTAVDPHALLADAGYSARLRDEVLATLANQNVMLVTDRPAGAPSETGKVAAATASLLRDLMSEARISRLVVAGGDTSTLAIRSLDIWGLSYGAPCVPGAPLCLAHSDEPRLDSLEIVLKGGQMGPPDFFAMVAEITG